MNADIDLFLLLNGYFSSGFWPAFFSVATYFGDGLLLAILILPVLYKRKPGIFRSDAPALVLSVAFSGLLVTALKVAVDRPRPPEYFENQGIEVHAPLGSPPDRSFPSGHTQTAFGAAVYLSCLFPHASPVFLVLAGVVGVSRIALGVHFPGDVLAGAVFGTVFSLLGFFANRWYRRRRQSHIT